MKKQILTLSLGLLSASMAMAAPTYTSFAPLPALIAGNTPAKDVAITTSVSGGLTLGLSVQQRISNAAPTDDNAGTFFVGTGSNFGNPALPAGPSIYQGSTWNFDFYIGGQSVGAYIYELSYGLAGGTVYTFNPTLDVDAITFFGTTGAYQDSQNLMFSNFGTVPNAFAGSFDPNADATYELLLKATPIASTGGAVVQSGITVVVGRGSAVPDAGSTLALMGAAFVGIAGLRRKFNA
jgi:protein with PEP-CTERM/exosortase system signal